MDFEKEIKKELKRVLKKDVELEIPPSNLGDYAFPCFQLAKKKKKNPVEIAKEISLKVKGKNFNVEYKGPYVNFFIDEKKLAASVLKEINVKRNKYGSKNNKGKIVIDYSHPNIAKPFGIGHLRSTVIGHSLYRILEHLGYKCVSVNHIGDWGTQFGKLIYAYKTWGNSKKLSKDPIGHLYSLYTKFHRKETIDPRLTEKGKEWFVKLEKGNSEARKWWKKFSDLSLKEFKKYYKELEIEFDSYKGESFYNKKLGDAIKKFKKYSKISDGALVVGFEDIPPMILEKSDGATTYATRDVAAFMYRVKQYKPVKLLYVVGTPQSLHFKQLFRGMNMIGYKKETIHVNFGHIRGMSTRKGNIVFLEDVLDKSVALIKKVIQKKNPKLKNKNTVAKQVGIGAVIFNDLSVDRIRDIDFDWDKMLSFEGETGPYVQYTHVRCCSILRRAKQFRVGKLEFEDEDYKLIKFLSKFGEVVERAGKDYKPHHVARYLIDLCSMFNEYYQKVSIIYSPKGLRESRLYLVKGVKQVLRNGLFLLGINAPGAM